MMPCSSILNVKNFPLVPFKYINNLFNFMDYQLEYNDDADDPNYRYKEEKNVRFAADDDIDYTELADLAADPAEPEESEEIEDPVEIDETAAEAAYEALDEENSSGIMDMDITLADVRFVGFLLVVPLGCCESICCLILIHQFSSSSHLCSNPS